MKIKSLVIITVLATAILGFGFAANAQTTNVQALIAQLQAQIAQLLAQIQVLQAQQNSAQTWCHTFNTNLKVGDKGNEIDSLWAALIKELPLEDRQNLSLDHEGMGQLSTFGEYTAEAVSAFQEKYASEILTPYKLKRGTGYVGPSTRAKLNSLYGCSTTPVPVSNLTADKILNSNGFVNGRKEDTLHQTGETLSNVVIGKDGDGSAMAVAIDTWCGASCGQGLVGFKLVNNNILMVKLPGSGVSGAAQNISSIQINNGVISDAETDFSGTKINYWQLSVVNGVLQANKINQPNPTNSLTLDALKSMYVDYGPGGQLNNGQYLSSSIDCTGQHGTCPAGNKFYLGLDTTTAKFGDFNSDGKQEAIVGVRYGYVSSNDDMTTAPLDAKTEFLALVQMVNGQPKIIDKLYGPTDIFGSWERINSIVVSNNQFTVNATEIVNYGDTTGQHEIRRIYQINIVNNKFQIISVAQQSVG